jgi:succinate-acetate transporter protein
MQDIDDDRPSPPLDRSHESLFKRLIFMLIIAAMMSMAQTILLTIAVIQFVVILIDNRQPNERLADFGCMVGAWVLKAARYMSVATDAKPWPFKEMD